MSTRRSRALAALDLHATLRAHLRTAEAAEWATVLLQEAERHDAGLPWKPQAGRPADARLGRAWCDLMGSQLEVASTIVIEPDLLPMALQAAEILPADAVMDHTSMRWEAGLLVLGEPVSIEAEGEVVMRWDAISWHPGAAGGRAGAWVTLWGRSPEMGGAWDHEQIHIPWGMPIGEAPAPGDLAAARFGTDSGDPLTTAARRHVVALWLMLHQSQEDTLLSSAEEPLSPGEQRAWARRRIPPRVVVIDLRHRPTAASGSGSGGRWGHRTIVRGHWRRQPYGPGRSERRLLWIAEHVAGPEDAPLIIPERVYRLAA